MYQYTKVDRYLEEARKGANELLRAMPEDAATGLYEGIAGTGFTLGEMYLQTRDEKYRRGVVQCIELLKSRAKQAGDGIEWKDGNDIISGAAGTGLFLLWAARELHLVGSRDLAIQVGERLLQAGESKGPGKTSWLMDATYPEMPNFSHGTAGVAYFLASLFLETKEKRFLDGALAGTSYLLSIADTKGQVCRIYHDDKHKDLYYLSWCHGPAGVARLFYQLYRATGDAQWMEQMKRAAKAMIVNGAPGTVVTPGEWNNISACCGVTAQAEFFQEMYEVTHDRQYRELARKGSDLLLKAATRDEQGVRWVQAEHRVKPELLQAQTGLMQGAAGAGLWLLRFGALSDGKKKTALRLPDNPFGF